MKKLLLLSLLLVLLVLSVPTLRDLFSPVIDPVGETLAAIVQPGVEAVRTPFLEWKARDEARAITGLLRDHEALGQRLPRPRDFQEFLQRRYTLNRDGLDPWGMPYYVLYADTAVIVGSPGPDLEANTADDVQEGFPRRLQ